MTLMTLTTTVRTKATDAIRAQVSVLNEMQDDPDEIADDILNNPAADSVTAEDVARVAEERAHEKDNLHGRKLSVVARRYIHSATRKCVQNCLVDPHDELLSEVTKRVESELAEDVTTLLREKTTDIESYRECPECDCLYDSNQMYH